MSLSEEKQLLWAVGNSIDHNMSRLAAESLLYGLFIGMFLYSSALFMRRYRRSTLIITLIAFLCASMHWSASVSFDLVQVRALLKTDLDLDMQGRIDLLTSKLFFQDIIAQWTGNLAPILSDFTLIWRAFVIYPDSRKFLGLPGLCLLASVGTTLYFNISLCNKVTWLAWASGQYKGPLKEVQIAMFFLSFGTNFLTTMFMGYKLWGHRQFLKEYLGGERRRKGVERVIGILLETGFIYSTFQISLAALAVAPKLPSDASSVMASIFLAMYTQLSAMYPVAVIIIVQLRVSIADAHTQDSKGFNNAPNGENGTTIQFNHGSTMSNSDNTNSVPQLETEPKADSVV